VRTLLFLISLSVRLRSHPRRTEWHLEGWSVAIVDRQHLYYLIQGSFTHSIHQELDGALGQRVARGVFAVVSDKAIDAHAHLWHTVKLIHCFIQVRSHGLVNARLAHHFHDVPKLPVSPRKLRSFCFYYII
jgi:hypothetical protein